jgi:hypothetical protein
MASGSASALPGAAPRVYFLTSGQAESASDPNAYSRSAVDAVASHLVNVSCSSGRRPVTILFSGA